MLIRPLVFLFSSHKAMVVHRNEGMRVRLQGLNYQVNYVPGKKANAENNEAAYNSRHPQPSRGQNTGAHSWAESTVNEEKGVFQKNIRAVVHASSPDAVSWDGLLQETSQDLTELTELNNVIARGYFTTPEREAPGQQFDPVHPVFMDQAVVVD